MSEIFSWTNWNKFMTSAQIRKMQKQMKKSYKKADKIRETMEEIAKKEEIEAEKLLEDLNV